MTMSEKAPLGAVLGLALAACQAPMPQDPYYVEPSPWSQQPAAAQPAAPAAADTAAEGDTVLEQLQETADKLADAVEQNQQLQSELDALNQTLEQLRGDNSSLQELADSLQADQSMAQTEVVQIEEKMREVEQTYREVVDELLAERIQRVRVERELILARIAEAKRAEDG